ncbi:MAG TPA: hypothetical protein VHA52_06480 [Candidatus Babeliaceae bacterium]|nr:hypothetical protein [Candidatus Babeliaceae bacterium]
MNNVNLTRLLFVFFAVSVPYSYTDAVDYTATISNNTNNSVHLVLCNDFQCEGKLEEVCSKEVEIAPMESRIIMLDPLDKVKLFSYAKEPFTVLCSWKTVPITSNSLWAAIAGYFGYSIPQNVEIEVPDIKDLASLPSIEDTKYLNWFKRNTYVNWSNLGINEQTITIENNTQE